MHKIIRVFALIIGAVIAIYLMVTLFFVFLVLAGIGLLVFLYAKFFGKGVLKTNNSSQGVTIEYAEYQSDFDENANEGSSQNNTKPPIEHDKKPNK